MLDKIIMVLVVAVIGKILYTITGGQYHEALDRSVMLLVALFAYRSVLQREEKGHGKT